MIGARSWIAGAFATLLLVATPSIALADPGTCMCNDGCHAFPGQCTHSNGCSPGYAPQCGERSTTCPEVGWISCDGTCTCVAIPGWDAGASGDGGSSSSDAGSGSKDGGSSGGSDGGVSPPPDGGGTYTDAGLPPPGNDAGCNCPTGTKCVGPDDFCASPCGHGEFPCPPSEVCTQGYCVPVCEIFTCKAPLLCDLSTGNCSSDPNAGADGGSISALDGGDFADGGEGGLGAQDAGDTSGCGCRSVGSRTTGAASALAMLGLVALAARRARKKRRD